MIKSQSTVLEFGPAHGRMTKFSRENLQCSVTIIELDTESGTEAAKYADRALIGEISNIESDHWLKLQGSAPHYILPTCSNTCTTRRESLPAPPGY